MALQIKQSLNLSQQLIMTPQLQQAIRLLQLSRLELVEEINQEIQTNPVLEEHDYSETSSQEPDLALFSKDFPEKAGKEFKDEFDWEAYLTEYNTKWYEFPSEERDLPSFEAFTSKKTDLYSHLMWQLRMNNLTQDQMKIGEYIIGNIDEDGYLKVSTDEISRDTGYPVDKVEEMLRIIQQFDPVGVGARDTKECLLIQIRFQNLQDTIVEKIISGYLDKLQTKRYDIISKELNITLDEVMKAVTIISNLEPKPGRKYNETEVIYIIPDIYVFQVGDDFEIVLNEDGLPKLRINSYYRDMLRDGSVPDSTKEYIQDKLRSAIWLIKSIHQRHRTIYRVTESIMKFQREFLEKGIKYLKPLILRDVAEDLQMHESTISRVTTNKYVHTPQGVFELKFFFNSAVTGLDGNAVSSESVKEHIRNIIKSENKAKPYSDQEIVEILKRYNINVARRTVAKYREAMNILPSRKRRNPF